MKKFDLSGNDYENIQTTSKIPQLYTNKPSKFISLKTLNYPMYQ